MGEGSEGTREGVTGHIQDERKDAEEDKQREGKKERGRNRRNLRCVPLCYPAVSTPTGTADAMSEFGHLSSTQLTRTRIYTHPLPVRGYNPSNGCPLTHSSKARKSPCMHFRPSHSSAGPWREQAGHHVTSAHCTNQPPRGTSAK